MTGQELLEWAVEQCRLTGTLPLDRNILMFIRGLPNVLDLVKAKAEGKAGAR